VFSLLRQSIIEGPDSLAERARRRRWRLLQRTFPDLGQMRVLDLGGTAESWERAPVQPRHVHLVNTERDEAKLPSWITSEVGDACALDEGLLDGRFDLVYSNSVIEHVGGHERRLQFAAMVDAAAPRHWIQTPYRYFPIEPHTLVPALQFLPLWFRARLTLFWPLNHTKPTDLDDSIATQLNTELLDITLLHHYFPASVIRCERIAGLVKSIIAVTT
jgi:hypothetical protein